jgi:hypothetical protein
VEKLKDEYRQMKAPGRRSAISPKRIKRLESQLEDLPEWGSLTPQEQRRIELLEKIEQALGAGDGRTPRSGRTSRGHTQKKSAKRSSKKRRG